MVAVCQVSLGLCGLLLIIISVEQPLENPDNPDISGWETHTKFTGRFADDIMEL